MSFLNTRIDHNRSKESAEWLEEEIAEQLERYKKIVSDMDAASEKREQWYKEFFDRIQDQGFNMDGDARMKIADDDLPVKPDTRHKVVY